MSFKSDAGKESEKDNSSLEMAMEADPSMTASRPASASDNPQEVAKAMQRTGSTVSTSTASSTAPIIPPSTPKKPMKSLSSATASTLALATTTTVGTYTSAAMMRAAKKKVVELECHEVRWHYKKPGDSKWTPFRGYDSMILEVSYRAAHGIQMDKKTASIAEQLPQTTNVIVLDNLFEWNPQENSDEVTSVYWKDESMKVRRGTWFYMDTLQPVAEELANNIEEHHLEKFRNQVIPDAPVFSENEANKKPGE